MLQNLMVTLIVALAFAYVLRKYLPAPLRRRLVHWFSRRGARQARVAAWLDTSSSCASDCDSCRACAPAGPDDAATKPRVIPIRPV